MVGVEHKNKTLSIKKEVEGDIRFILGNKRGGYLMLPSDKPSRYDGFFIFDREEREMYKIIDSFGIPFTKLTHRTTSAETENTTYYLLPGKDSLVLETASPVELCLDIRKSYDLREWGRYYSVEEDKHRIIISFSKKTDTREDTSQATNEYTIYVVINHDGIHELKGEWIKKEYPKDIERGSPPFERHVYSPAKIVAKKIVITASKNRSLCLKEAEKILKKKTPDVPKYTEVSPDKNTNFAYNLAVEGISNLFVAEGILAGLPWFFQYWTRDEAVSTGALIREKRYDEAKKILFRELDHIQPDGRIVNQIPRGGIATADANGWCFLRLGQLLELDKLTKIEKTFLVAKIDYILSKSHPIYVKEHLVYNNEKETWMDTTVDGKDAREGARIEIQALQLSLYKLLYGLTKQEGCVEVAKGLKARVKQEFFDGEKLADGLGDYTQRPNIFIAYYAYPDLLSNQEWKKAFDTAIKALWLTWGGLSTIDKKDRLFCPNHTGEDNRSYHRGDSWYWINNLAAICMYRLDRDRYNRYIEKILDASTREILWMGAVGGHAEISSASKQESRGCLQQAWSLATYIELVHELYIKK